MDTRYFSIEERSDGWWWEDQNREWHGPCETRTKAVDEQIADFCHPVQISSDAQWADPAVDPFEELRKLGDVIRDAGLTEAEWRRRYLNDFPPKTEEPQ